MKSRIYLFFCFVTLNCCLVKAQNPAIDTLKTWMEFLSSDEMKGRANGSVENIEIADWIAGKLLNYGVQPLPNKQWLMQDYPFPEQLDRLSKQCSRVFSRK